MEGYLHTELFCLYASGDPTNWKISILSGIGQIQVLPRGLNSLFSSPRTTFYVCGDPHNLGHRLNTTTLQWQNRLKPAINISEASLFTWARNMIGPQNNNDQLSTSLILLQCYLWYLIYTPRAEPEATPSGRGSRKYLTLEANGVHRRDRSRHTVNILAIKCLRL